MARKPRLVSVSKTYDFVNDLSYPLNVDELIDKLKEACQELGLGENFAEVSITKDSVYDDEALTVHGSRPENEAEVKERRALARKRRAEKEKQKEKEAQMKMEMYLRLKKELGQ